MSRLVVPYFASKLECEGLLRAELKVSPRGCCVPRLAMGRRRAESFRRAVLYHISDYPYRI